MFTFVSADWVEAHLEAPEFIVVDPRSQIRYRAGHAPHAINVPVAKARDGAGRISGPAALAEWLGAQGLGDGRIPVVYDQADGRQAALLAWMLAYLGRDDVRLMETFWEAWVSDGREVLYRPVAAAPAAFTARPRPELRAACDEMRHNARAAAPRTLVDVRSRDEYDGRRGEGEHAGHIPGALHLAWTELAGADGAMLAPPARLAEIFAAHGVGPQDRVVTCCQSGARAALAFLALARLGRAAALFDGSFAEWSQKGLPVERTPERAEGERA